MKNKIILMVILFVALVACEDDGINRHFDIVNKFKETHNGQQLDETATTNQLIGKWKWIYTICCVEGNKLEGRRTEDENMVIQISRSTIKIFKDDVLIQTSDWSLRIEDRTFFGIKGEPSVNNTGGKILFSGDWVLFHSSYVDGPDNYFEKIPSGE